MPRTKKTFLFLHGALGISQDLTTLMDMVKELGHDGLTFNFSGHGKNGQPPEEFRIDLFARDLDRYIQEHQLKDVVVMGYSMGGYVALYYQAHYENSPIKQIFTYGTKFNWSESAVGKELLMLDPDHLESKFPAFADSLKEKHGERWKWLLRATAHMMQNLEKLDGLTKEDLSDLEIPVVLMIGDQDRMVTFEETNRAKSWLHHSLVKTITHSKHELEKANLKEIAGIIASSL